MRSNVKSSRAISVLSYLFFNVLLFASLLLLYIANTWDNISLNEVIFHATHSLEGVSSKLVLSCLTQTILPFIIFNIIYIYKLKIYKIADFVIVSSFIVLTTNAIINLKVFYYIKNRGMISNFIETHYVDPKNVEITFKKKRNLIYIYLESMESSFADKKHGGFFEEHLIPHLTELAEANTNFSGKDGGLNGAYSPAFTTWTMAAIFAQSTGLPLQIPIEDNNMHSQREFFPSIVSSGDILEQYGYYQEVIVGSNAHFTGMENYFIQHGNFQVTDYNYLVKDEIVVKKYKTDWGIDDHKLFEIAKERISAISKNKEHFNITLITMDTHYDGKMGQHCEKKFPDNEYKNVIYCADNQVAEFIRWIQGQDFYKNTTIVISGDHPSMKSNFIDNRKYTRKVYNTYINAHGHAGKDFRRMFTVFDIFPTTLAALGAAIPGNRLGLGVNLFSDEATLAERYGYPYMDRELSKKSLFFKDKMDFSASGLMVNAAPQYYGATIQSHTNKNKVTLEVDLNNLNIDTMQHGSYLEIPEIDYNRPLIAHIYQNGTINYSKSVTLKRKEQKKFVANIPLSAFKNNLGYIQVYAQDRNGGQLLLGTLQGDMRDFKEYIRQITDKNFSIFITINPHFSKTMTAEVKSGLRELGLDADFPYHFLLGYYAVLDGGHIIEQHATDINSKGVEYSSSLSGNNTISYSVRSGNFNITNGGSSAIVIGGKTYSNNIPGLNVVVYNNKLNMVVDSATF